MKSCLLWARTAAIASLAVASAVGAPARADVKIVSEVNVSGLPAAAAAQMKGAFPQTVTVYYKGEKMRTETAGSPAVTIYDCTADKLYTLDTAKKTYTVASVKGMLDAANPMMAMMKFDTTANVKPGGASKVIAGQPAKNYTYMATIKMGMEGASPDMAGMFPTMTMRGEQWTTDAITLPANCQRMMASSFARTAGPMLKGMKPLIDQMATIKGAPLSSRMTMTLASKQPLPGLPTEPIVTTNETKSISQATLDDALFTVPAGYKEVRAAAPAARPGAAGGSHDGHDHGDHDHDH
jgi:hypothetical protein